MFTSLSYFLRLRNDTIYISVVHKVQHIRQMYIFSKKNSFIFRIKIFLFFPLFMFFQTFINQINLLVRATCYYNISTAHALIIFWIINQTYGRIWKLSQITRSIVTHRLIRRKTLHRVATYGTWTKNYFHRWRFEWLCQELS